VSADVRLVELRRDRAGIARFLEVSYAVYRRDPHWVAPIWSDRRKVLGPENPFFAHARMAMWVAVRDDHDVGSIAAVVDDHHNERHGEATVFFGFFESVNDSAVSRLLFDAVRGWAGRQGMRGLLGPMNPSINEECGLLVEGFDTPPVLMMTYNPPYYAALFEDAGLSSCKDLFAYHVSLDDSRLARLDRLAARVLDRLPDVTIRPIRKASLPRDLAKIQEIYNAAWDHNWGHVPMTAAEVEFMATRLKPLLDEKLVLLAETAEEPVAFIIALPDLNEALGKLRGRLLSPRLLFALPYLVGLRRPRIVRVMAMGIKPAYRKRGLDAALFGGCLRASLRAGFVAAELSWVLEDNVLMLRVGEMFGGTRYKTYRLYEGVVTPSR
jgi:GNAT superfamily N-acetyltransferase